MRRGVLWLALWAAGCAERSATSGSEPPPARPDAIPEAPVDGPRQRIESLFPRIADPAAEREHELGGAEAGTTAGDVRFAWRAGDPAESWVFMPDADQAGVAALPEGAATPDGLRLASGALAAVVPVRADQFFEVELEARVLPEDGRPEAQPADFVVIAQPLTEPTQLERWLEDRSLRELGARRGTRTRLRPSIQLEPGRPGEAQRRSVRLHAPFDATALLLTVLFRGDSAGVELNALRLHQLSLRRGLELDRPEVEVDMPPEAGGLHGEIEGLPSELARRVDVYHELRDALLLPPPARLSFRTLLPEGDVVLEFGRALLDEVREGWRARPLRLVVSLEDEDGATHELHREELGPEDDSGWQDRQLELGRWSDQLVRLEFRTEGEGCEDVLALGSPVLRVREPGDERLNVIIVSLDTLRADRLSGEGYPRPTSPFLDQLARESWWYRNVGSTSSYTLPSHASLLTGQLPRLHGVRRVGIGLTQLSARRSEPLAIRLRAEGYATAAYTGGGYMGPDFGFGLGFERFNWLDVLLTEEDGRWTIHPRSRDEEFNLRHRRTRDLQHVLRWTESQKDGPFFLLLHTYLVHNYRPSPRYRAMFYEDRGSELGDSLQWPRRRLPDGSKISEVDCRHYTDLYDATVREADDLVAQLVEGLKQQGLWDRSIVLIMADHGEEFAERGEMGHGHSLYEELLRVPAILHVPGARPREVHAPVSLIDFQPTLMDLLGLPQRFPVQGRSLRDEAEDAGPRPLFADLARAGIPPRLSVREGDWKLIATFDDDAVEGQPHTVQLFDLAADPRERTDRSTTEPAVRDALLQRLLDMRRQLQEHHDSLGGGGEAGLLPDDVRAQLQRLGYLPPDENEEEDEEEGDEEGEDGGPEADEG